MHPCVQSTSDAVRPDTLPDVGAPEGLLVIALLGLAITLAGFVAMMMSRR